MLKPGSVFGEVGFVSPGPRTGDALALEGRRLLRFDGEALDQADAATGPSSASRSTGASGTRWPGKLRATNEQLKTFFTSDKQPENFLRLRRARETVTGQIEVPSEDKLSLLREQGLSGKELTTLANFSRELRFESGSALFEEGDEGHEMYVVLEGKALISKYIPGAGEEALAILERGDFFGEMSLIDGEPRSADARAHGGPVTVLALDQGTIQEMLALDPAGLARVPPAPLPPGRQAPARDRREGHHLAHLRRRPRRPRPGLSEPLPATPVPTVAPRCALGTRASCQRQETASRLSPRRPRATAAATSRKGR